MSVRIFGRASSGDESAQAAPENVDWLPRARLRSGGRGDRLLTGLIVVTASVLAAAAGFAAWSRHGDFTAQQSAATSTPSAPARQAIAPPAPPAPASAPAPVRNVAAAPSAPPVAAPSVVPGEPREDAAASRVTMRAEPVQTTTAAPVTTIRTTPSGVPIETTRATVAAAAPPPVEISPPPMRDAAPPIPPAAPAQAPIPLASAPRPASGAPLTNFSAGTFDVLPAIVGDSPVGNAPPPSGVRAQSNERAAPATQRTAAATPPPTSSGGRVAVYMDGYPDQKAAAAALSQKSGAYSKYIGSAGRLTYTRRGNDWRLRVSNLDQATAEAICARMQGSGAPCSVGPN